MRIAVLGTGMVGRTIATKLVELGDEVTMGSRTADNENAREWVAGAGAGAAQATFADAAAGAELVFNCTGGAVAVEVAGAPTWRWSTVEPSLASSSVAPTRLPA